MTRMRLAALLALAAACGMCGCKMEPDITSQKDMGFSRPERSGEVMAERSGPPSEDTTTPASVRERQAADALASGKGDAGASAATLPGSG